MASGGAGLSSSDSTANNPNIGVSVTGPQLTFNESSGEGIAPWASGGITTPTGNTPATGTSNWWIWVIGISATVVIAFIGVVNWLRSRGKKSEG
jgi:hypothetical protein